jgi:hypothetical protein
MQLLQLCKVPGDETAPKNAMPDYHLNEGIEVIVIRKKKTL